MKGLPGKTSGARPRPAGRVQGPAYDLAGRRDRPHRGRQGRLRVGAPVRRRTPAGPGPRPRPARKVDAMIRTEFCDLLGIEHPVVGFSPSEHVAAAVSRAGGLGVLGCVRFNDPAELDDALTWMDEHTEGRPYGVDVVM